jgi:hypothetical protein
MLAFRSGFIQLAEVPRQQAHATHVKEALAAALEQSGSAMLFLRAAFNIVRQCSNFMKSQVVAEEGEAKRKVREVERKAVEAE